jgi:uncharacterized protein (DUF433 family)
MTVPNIELGTGIYYPAEAAGFLGLPPDKLQRWASGYTFWSQDHQTRSKSDPVIQPDLPRFRGRRAVSFLELMELRVVARLRERGLSLQYIRSAGRIARRTFRTRHPFATHKVYTDGKAIFTGLTPDPEDPDVIELTRDRHSQVILGAVFAPFLDDMSFDPETGLAARWWPLGRRVPVVLDPLLAFGAPVVEGTRIQTYVVAGMARRGSIREASDAYELTAAQVQAAIEFERQLRHAA